MSLKYPRSLWQSSLVVEQFAIFRGRKTGAHQCGATFRDCPHPSQASIHATLFGFPFQMLQVFDLSTRNGEFILKKYIVTC